MNSIYEKKQFGNLCVGEPDKKKDAFGVPEERCAQDLTKRHETYKMKRE
ncbi:MAG: hypothetical protein IKY23_06935 [Lachnospiraceae bacterium]|nr:hypothetical protein [Lachnospiraceae bacterium]